MNMRAHPASPQAFSPLFIAALTATLCHRRQRILADPFSPLFIAALTATNRSHEGIGRRCIAFSPLFIAALTATSRWISAESCRNVFQSAFHRGTHCYLCYKGYKHSNWHLSVRFSSRHSLLQRRRWITSATRWSFSPLFIAALTATKFRLRSGIA